MDAVAQVARTVLYEGYLLWPYRRSTIKNRQRWTFGGVYPRAHSEPRGGDDPWIMQTQCLLEGGDDARVDVVVRFLHVVERRVAEERGGALEFVDELVVGAERFLAFQEATEREFGATGLAPASLAEPVRVAVEVAEGREKERVGPMPAAAAVGSPPDSKIGPPPGQSHGWTGRSSETSPTGHFLRTWEPLRGEIAISAERLAPRLFRLTVRIANTTPFEPGDREAALRRTFVSTHTILHATPGDFVSLTDPPEGLRDAAAACVNTGTWPVLAGEEGERSTVLSSPIVLPDHPRVAPESPGDLFDGTEIDQLLVLSVLAMTDEEKAEMRATDPKAREILDRCAALTPEQLMRLHGAIREFRPVRVGEAAP